MTSPLIKQPTHSYRHQSVIMISLPLITLPLAAASQYALLGQGNQPSHRAGHDLCGNAQVWDLKNFSALVAFGDSYTDDSRLDYFYNSRGEPPPVGWVNPPNNDSACGGYPWPDWVHWYSGARIYNYAVSGAVCSSRITPRFSPITNANLPDIEQYEVPAWLADKQHVEPSGKKLFDTPPDETVYSMWIGTNDLNMGTMLEDSQRPGTNVTTYLDCVFDQLQRIYQNGARYFVLQNLVPLHLSPLTATPENGGLGPNYFWPAKPPNSTAISYKMMETVVTANMVYQYRTPFEVVLARRFPGARFALMDMYRLVSRAFPHNLGLNTDGLAQPDSRRMEQPKRIPERHGTT